MKKRYVKIIKNNIIPLKKFVALTMWPWIFIRRVLYDMEMNHELIHCDQQLEMLIIGAVLFVLLLTLGCEWWSLLGIPVFFWWYLIEWLIRLAIYRNLYEAYRNIAFEQEAYLNQHSAWYTDERRHFSWVKYLNRKTFRKI